ncbi:MAG: AFG1 family ATPase [Proteobacteria bacterium]|nr:AFG1 family ATPase [Pseudomonadota bacterium]
MTPIETYQHDIKSRGFVSDKSQETAVLHTQALYEQLLQPPKAIPRRNFFFLKSLKTQPIKGLYFWGGVGRGKSYLIDAFYDCLPFKEKKRIHFNHFMQDIHSKLKHLPKTPDPLILVAQALATKYRVICIDEFHVDDITDAMIMASFLHALFEQRVTLLFTSNTSPDRLYLNGLQRNRFLPAIDLIKERTKIIKLDNETDYRLGLSEKHKIFHVSEARHSDKIMQQHLAEFGFSSADNKDTIQINGRSIRCRARDEQLIWFDFKELCQTARSSSDYIVIAKRFKRILVSDILAMDDSHNDIVQRFIQLIDALYDHRVKLIATAALKPELLYQGKSLAFPFKRTLSRLFEMRSESYLSQS